MLLEAAVGLCVVWCRASQASLTPPGSRVDAPRVVVMEVELEVVPFGGSERSSLGRPLGWERREAAKERAASCSVHRHRFVSSNDAAL